jgi:hypothetical protein
VLAVVAHIDADCDFAFHLGDFPAGLCAGSERSHR